MTVMDGGIPEDLAAMDRDLRLVNSLLENLNLAPGENTELNGICRACLE